MKARMKSSTCCCRSVRTLMLACCDILISCSVVEPLTCGQASDRYARNVARDDRISACGGRGAGPLRVATPERDLFAGRPAFEDRSDVHGQLGARESLAGEDRGQMRLTQADLVRVIS